MWVIGHGSHLLGQVSVLGVFRDSDDFDLAAGIGAADAKALAERRAIREKTLRHRFTDYRDFLRLIRVLRAKAPPLYQRNPHRHKIVRADDVVADGPALSF